MNLTKLFEAQKVLRDRIDYNEPDRFNKLILALLVELGECANEWRGFKFWSKRQRWDIHIGRKKTLEEYADGLHFILELGLELEIEDYRINSFKISQNIVDQFQDIYIQIGFFTHEYRTSNESIKHTYKTILSLFLGLGEMLGFTWEEIEEAYFAKNAVNHQRQETGY